MKAVFDTSSLVALIKYYLPFDYNATLLGQIEEHLVTGEMIIIDEVLNECKGTAQGIVISKLSFLGEPTFLKKHKIVKQTDSLLPPSQKKISNMLNDGVDLKVKVDDITLLTYGVMIGNVEIIAMLIQAGANINQRSGNTLTPLAHAAACGAVEEFMFLADAGVNLKLTYTININGQDI
jgi:hypothetical protein